MIVLCSKTKTIKSVIYCISITANIIHLETISFFKSEYKDILIKLKRRKQIQRNQTQDTEIKIRRNITKLIISKDR